MVERKWIIATIIILVIVGAAYTLYPRPEERVIRVGHLKDDHHSALFIAQAKEMYEKEGLKVEIIEFNAGPDFVKAAATGQIDIGYCGTPPAVTGIAKGVPIKIVAAVNQEGSGIVVGENTGIQKIEDLKGKTIAIPMKGSIQDVLLQMALKEHGINPEDVNIIEMQVPLMPKALEAGRIDGFIAWEPYVSMAEQKGYGHAIAYSRDIWKDHPCCVVIATDQFIKEHPDQLRKFLKIHVEATEYLNSHKDESASIVAKTLGTDPEVEKRAFQNMKFLAVPTGSFIDNVLKFVEIEKQLGYIKKDLKRDDIFNLEYLP
ncbi:MAG: ABC transporter substrate-binding protein [Methanobacteriales archaeon]